MVSGDRIAVRTPLLEYPPGWTNFADLMQHCWETVRQENGGSPNVFGTAHRLYDGLLAMSSCSLLSDETSLPDRDTFVYNVRVTMLQPELFQRVLYPGALETADRMSQVGPVLFWTTGDMYGGSDAHGNQLEGSMEQFFRVMNSGIINYACEQAREAGRPIPAFNVAGAEDKFAFLPRCFDWLTERDATDIVLLEDKLPNITLAQRIVQELDIPANLHFVWLRQGRHGTIDEEVPEGVHSLPNIADFPALLESLDLERPGFLADYDGVFSNDERRAYLQQLAVWNLVCEQGWVQGAQYEAIH